MQMIFPHLALLYPQNPDPAIPWANCAVYALFDEEALVLIDGGNGLSAGSLLAELRALGVMERREKALLLTHCHYDHSGGVQALQGEFSVFASELTVEILRRIPHQVLYEAPELVPPLEITGFPDDAALDFGALHLETHPLRGHTDDSTAFLATIDGRRCLFSGDLVMYNGELGWQGSDDYSLAKTCASLEWMLRQEYDYWFTGHDFLPHNGHQILAATLAACRQRL